MPAGGLRLGLGPGRVSAGPMMHQPGEDPPSLRRPFPLTSDLASDLKRASFLEKQGRTIEKRKRDVDQLIDQLIDQTDRSMIGQLIGHA